MLRQINLSEFLANRLETSSDFLQLNILIEDIADACKIINHHVRLGSIENIIDNAGGINIQGEEQKQLDIISNQIVIDQLMRNESVVGMASEEEERFIVANTHNDGFLVLFDPLDGSSNVNVNISVGSIFSILKKENMRHELSEEDFLQQGKKQIAALYVLYGPQTQMVLTFGEGVFGFSLNDKNEFILTMENCSIPIQTKEFAINMSNYHLWQQNIRNYIDELLKGTKGKRKKSYNMRWNASLVAEVHRILMRGGIFLYPQDSRIPFKDGKLRLLYEVNPMSLLITQAAGKASNGLEDILNIKPLSLHQRIPTIFGSSEEVEFLLSLSKS